MKIKFLALVAAALALVGAAQPAAAADFGPPGLYTLSGPLRFQLSGVTLTCNVQLNVRTGSNGVGQPNTTVVTGASFTGGSILCPTFTAQSLPWTMTPTGFVSAQFQNVAINSPLGSCGPGTLPASVIGTTYSINGALPFCSVMGTLTASPLMWINYP